MNQTSSPSSGWHRQVPCLFFGATTLAQKQVVGQEGTVSTKTGNIPSCCVTAQWGTPREMGAVGLIPRSLK